LLLLERQRTIVVAIPVKSLHRRVGSFALMAGVGLGLNFLTPQRASALTTLWYNSPVDASLLGTTGSLDGANNDYWVLGEIKNLNSTQVEIKLTTNFGSAGNFAGGNPPPGAVFNLSNVVGTPTFTSCTPSTLSGTTPSAGTVACTGQSPLLTYDSTGGIGFIASVGWELGLNMPPPPGGPDNTLGSTGEILTFVVSGLQESNFTPNAAAGGTYGCVHGQELLRGGSTRLCATLAGSPPVKFSVPGPLPLFGAAAAFGYSRKLRTRIQSFRQQATIS
jgi:hypothetical protein